MSHSSVNPALRTTRRPLLGLLLLVLAMTVLPIGPPTAQAAPPGVVVSLTFDDGLAAQAPAGETLRSRGLRGTFYVVDQWIGAPGYLSRSDLTTLAAAGHEIGGHTVTHPELPTVDPGEARRQVCNDRARLEAWGFRPVSFAYPYASADAGVEQIVAACGYTTARGLGDVRSGSDCRTCVRAESVQPADPMYLKAPVQVDSTWTLARMKAQVTQARTAGGWVILTFHDICAPAGSSGCDPTTSTSPTTFQSFVQWLAAYQQVPANGTTVRTIDEQVRVSRGANYPAYQPAAVSPAPPPVAPGLNAITNASLEVLDPASGLPACFQRGGWGANTATFSTIAPGRTGVTAAQVSVTGYASGDAKLLPTMDLGQCTPSVVPGETYRVGVWHRSSAVTQFALYYRDAIDRWFYWTSSPWFDPATEWTFVSFDVVVPPEARGMSAGLAAITNGAVVTDDYSLVDQGPATQARGTGADAAVPVEVGAD